MVENSLGLPYPRPPLHRKRNHALLIEQLQASSGPNREMDALIAAAVEPYIFDAPGFAPVRPVPAFRVEAEGILRFDGGGILCMSYIPRYTSSVDASLILLARILPGWGGLLGLGSADSIHTVDLWSEARGAQDGEDEEVNPRHGEDSQAEHKSLPIALCVAILEAHGAMNG